MAAGRNGQAQLAFFVALEVVVVEEMPFFAEVAHQHSAGNVWGLEETDWDKQDPHSAGYVDGVLVEEEHIAVGDSPVGGQVSVLELVVHEIAVDRKPDSHSWAAVADGEKKNVVAHT